MDTRHALVSGTGMVPTLMKDAVVLHKTTVKSCKELFKGKALVTLFFSISMLASAPVVRLR